MGNEAEARLHFSGKDSHTAQGRGHCRAGDRWGASTRQVAECGGLQCVEVGIGGGWVQDLHALLPHGEMPKLRFH